MLQLQNLQNGIQHKRLYWFYRRADFIDCLSFKSAGKISKDGLLYILMNVAGAGFACVASWLIRYIPFVILEGTWTLVSLFALINYLRKSVY